MLREPRFFIGLAGAAGTLAGAIATLAVAERPLTVEARVAFWLLITLFIVFLIYLTFPLIDPLVVRFSSSLEQHRKRLEAKREFPEWAHTWFALIKVIRKAAWEALPVKSETNRQYQALRKDLQKLHPEFLPRLEKYVRERVLQAFADHLQIGPPQLHQQVAYANHPFRLFYVEPNLEKLVRSLRPNMYSHATFSMEKDLEDLDNLLNRLCDLVREFGASLGIDVDCFSDSAPL